MPLFLYSDKIKQYKAFKRNQYNTFTMRNKIVCFQSDEIEYKTHNILLHVGDGSYIVQHMYLSNDIKAIFTMRALPYRNKIYYTNTRFEYKNYQTKKVISVAGMKSAKKLIPDIVDQSLSLLTTGFFGKFFFSTSLSHRHVGNILKKFVTKNIELPKWIYKYPFGNISTKEYEYLLTNLKV